MRQAEGPTITYPDRIAPERPASGIQFLGWKIPSTDWVGLQKFISWLFDLPFWTIPAFLAFGAFSEWKETT